MVFIYTLKLLGLINPNNNNYLFTNNKNFFKLTNFEVSQLKND